VALSRHTTRPRFTLLVLVLASVTVLTLDFRGGVSLVRSAKADARDLFTPIESAFRSVERPVADFFDGALHYHSLLAENARLRAENVRLRAASLGAASAERQLQQLMALEHLPFAPNLRTIPAEVVGTSGSNFEATVEIDKGTAAGVRAGMPVVAGTGLVGRVVEASRLQSTVLLVTDPTSAVGVRFGKGHLAVAIGQGPGEPLRVEFVDPRWSVRRGELMATSGVRGDLYPPGIPIGTVASVSSPPNALAQDVTLSPLVDLNRLEFVDVLQWLPSAP
jgi:rod shape-determining protein MreC